MNVRRILAVVMLLGAANGAVAALSWQVGDCARGGACPETTTPSPSPTASPTPGTPGPSPTFTASPTVTRTPVGGAFALRLDSGAELGHTDLGGKIWHADRPFALSESGWVVPGAVFNTTEAVQGTQDPSLYQNYREGEAIEYRFSVPNGAYEVTLHFCDFSSLSAAQRVMSVTSQAVLRTNTLDILAQVGRARAYQLVFDVLVSDGTLLVQLGSPQGKAILSAIEIRGLQQQFPLIIHLSQPLGAVRLP